MPTAPSWRAHVGLAPLLPLMKFESRGIGRGSVPALRARFKRVYAGESNGQSYRKTLAGGSPFLKGGPTMFTSISRPRPPRWSVVVSDNWSMYADDDAPDAAGEFASAEAAIAACEARVDRSIAWIVATSRGLDLSKGSDDVYDAWRDGGDSPGIR